MDAGLLDHPCAVDVRERTNALVNGLSPTIVRVDTNEIWQRDDWPRAEFFAWFDRRLDSSDYRNEYELARAAGVSHSAISSWRKGRQRPGTASLRKLAPKLGVGEAEILTRAGDPNATIGGAHEPSAEERRAIQLIRSSNLSPSLQERLVREYLEEAARSRDALERSLQSKIDLLKAT